MHVYLNIRLRIHIRNGDLNCGFQSLRLSKNIQIGWDLVVYLSLDCLWVIWS